MLNNEIWKDVPDLPYEISNFGVVRRKEGKFKHKNKAHIKPYLKSYTDWIQYKFHLNAKRLSKTHRNVEVSRVGCKLMALETVTP